MKNNFSERFARRANHHEGAGLLADLDNDFRLLLRTERGRKSLAANYISQPSLRRHLTDIAVTLDPVTQQKFLDELTVEMDRRQ